jgi:chemotaxis protein MotA
LKKIDILTPIGIIIGFIAISIAVFNVAGFNGAVGFISIAALFTVFGGLIASLLVNYSIAEIKVTFTVLKQAFFQKEAGLATLIDTFVTLSTKARREGLLSLEQELSMINEPYIEKGITLAIDGLEPELIKDIMMAEVIAMEERHKKGRQIIEKAGEMAPAWGMIGTIVGLVLMLQTLNEPETLGPKMAVALVTTFYGAILANLVFLPIAGKLENQSEEEVFLKQIVIEGVLGVQSGQNPKILEEKLRVFLPPKKREKEKAQMGEGAISNET